MRLGGCNPITRRDAERIRLGVRGSFPAAYPSTPPRDDALALLLTFGSANTWCQDFHLTSTAPCLAHTSRITGRAKRAPPALHASVFTRRLVVGQGAHTINELLEQGLLLTDALFDDLYVGSSVDRQLKLCSYREQSGDE